MIKKLEPSCSPVPDGIFPARALAAMNSTHSSPIRKRRASGSLTLLRLASVFSVAWLVSGDLRADPGYTAKSGKIAFVVGSNVPLLKVSGLSTSVTGGGEGTVNGETAKVLNLLFEVDPTTFKTGMKVRDDHMYEKVFKASDGSLPRIVLRAERFQGEFNSKTSKWEGELKAQLTMRGVTKPVSFNAMIEKKGDGAVVSAQGTVKLSVFGVQPIGYAGAKVHDEVAVTVSNMVINPSNRK